MELQSVLEKTFGPGTRTLPTHRHKKQDILFSIHVIKGTLFFKNLGTHFSGSNSQLCCKLKRVRCTLESWLLFRQYIQDRTAGITVVVWLRVDDDYMDFLTVASQKLARAIALMLWCVGCCVWRSKSVEGLSLLPTMGSNLHPSHRRL